MAVDDSTYITPHEAALAVEATSMKKARMQLDVLILNSVMGGIVFGIGSILNLGIHSEDPDTWQKNPGALKFVGGLFNGIGLFYVVILGVDLFNSNILYFSVGFLRRSVNIYDVLISWFCSFFGNLGGCLLLSYVFVNLSSISTAHLWKIGSKKIAEERASFSFIQTFLKGIAGNFFVSLAIYLQLMAKPLHVKWLMITLPIFTLVSVGFTHVVADMPLLFLGMFNGANVSVGEYIWKLLIPASVGNILGGFAFAALIPFYLHLLAVERDKKKLSLPQYEERDEQPELNMDSRVVRIQPEEEKEEEKEAREEEEYNEKDFGVPERSSTDSCRSVRSENCVNPMNASDYFERPDALEAGSLSSYPVGRWDSGRSGISGYSTASTGLRRRPKTTPAGVFPVRGMTNIPRYGERRMHKMNDAQFIQTADSVSGDPSSRAASVGGSFAKPTNTNNEDSTEDYNVVDSKPGAKLEKAITRFITRTSSKQNKNELPRTTQETFPYNQPPASYSPHQPSISNQSSHRSGLSGNRTGQPGNSANIPRAKTPTVQRNLRSNTRSSG